MINNEEKRGMLALDKTIIIIISILVFIFVIFMIFQADIISWIKNLPGYSYQEEDREIELSLSEQIASQGECFIKISGDYLYIGEKKTPFYIKGEIDNAEIFWDKEGFDEKIGEIKNGKIVFDTSLEIFRNKDYFQSDYAIALNNAMLQSVTARFCKNIEDVEKDLDKINYFKNTIKSSNYFIFDINNYHFYAYWDFEKNQPAFKTSLGRTPEGDWKLIYPSDIEFFDNSDVKSALGDITNTAMSDALKNAISARTPEKFSEKLLELAKTWKFRLSSGDKFPENAGVEYINQKLYSDNSAPKIQIMEKELKAGDSIISDIPLNWVFSSTIEYSGKTSYIYADNNGNMINLAKDGDKMIIQKISDALGGSIDSVKAEYIDDYYFENEENK